MTNKMKTRILIIIMLFLGSAPAWAQTELTLRDAVDYALKNKADALKADLDVKNAHFQIEEARANVLPQINAQAGITYNPKLQQMALDLGEGKTSVITMGTPWQSTPAVQLDQQIFNMSVFQGLKAARSTKEFYQLNASLTEEQIIEKVANSYFEVYKTKSEIQTMDKTIKNTTRVRDVIAGLEKDGLAKKVDLDRTNVSLNNLKSSRVKLVNSLKLQENALKYLIGMDIAMPVVFPDNTFDVSKKIYDKNGFNISNRTEVKLLEKQEDLLRINKKAIEAGRYPSLALSANYGYMAMGSRFPYFAGSKQGVNGSDFAAISLNLNIPIFNGFSVRSKVSQAQIEIEKTRLDITDTKLALNLDVENAYTQMNNAVITLNSQESNKGLAEQVLENVENNYKNGLASLTDLLDAETSYADAQNNYTAAVLDYKLAEVQLKKAKGELKSSYSNIN